MRKKFLKNPTEDNTYYRSYKHFSNEYLRKSFLGKSSKNVKVNNGNGFQRFCYINITTINAQIESQKEVCQKNQMTYLTNDSSKAINLN